MYDSAILSATYIILVQIWYNKALHSNMDKIENINSFLLIGL